LVRFFENISAGRTRDLKNFKIVFVDWLVVYLLLVFCILISL